MTPPSRRCGTPLFGRPSGGRQRPQLSCAIRIPTPGAKPHRLRLPQATRDILVQETRNESLVGEPLLQGSFLDRLEILS